MKKLICVTLLVFTIQSASDAEAAPINLNDFFADLTVTVAADGSSADFLEDPIFSIVVLSNDPGLGDPNVIFPGPGISLTFDFDFLEAPGANVDEFGAFVIDAATGLSAGPAFEFFTDTTSSGNVSFDLSSLTGKTLGLQFQLSSLPSDIDLTSTLTVSNVNVIPEPSTFTLLGIGAVALVGHGWWRRRKRAA